MDTNFNIGSARTFTSIAFKELLGIAEGLVRENPSLANPAPFSDSEMGSLIHQLFHTLEPSTKSLAEQLLAALANAPRGVVRMLDYLLFGLRGISAKKLKTDAYDNSKAFLMDAVKTRAGIEYQTGGTASERGYLFRVAHETIHINVVVQTKSGEKIYLPMEVGSSDGSWKPHTIEIYALSKSAGPGVANGFELEARLYDQRIDGSLHLPLDSELANFFKEEGIVDGIYKHLIKGKEIRNQPRWDEMEDVS